MFEVSDFDAIDNVYPFLRAIFYSMCSLIDTTEATKALIE